MPAAANMGHRVLSACGAGLDRSALPWMQALWLLDGNPDAAEVRAQQEYAFDRYADPALLAQPDRFFPQPPVPRIETRRVFPLWGGRVERVRWQSGYRTYDSTYQDAFDAHQANQTCRAEIHRHTSGARGTIVCIHSWATGYYWLQREAFPTRALYRSGLDVVLFMLPFHGPRNPRGSWYGGQMFPGTDPQRTNEAFGQAVWDLRGLVGWLEAQGRGPIGVIGQSLGGYITALLAALEPRLHYAVPMIPLVSLGDIMWELGSGTVHRKRAEARGVTVDRLRQVFRIHCPLTHTPQIPRDQRMIIAGRGDRIISEAHLRPLWEHWERPKLHWFPGGHMIHFQCGPAFEQVIALTRN